MKIIGYGLQVILGWGVLAFLMYQYVFKQSSLIENETLLALIIAIGTILTFIFSSLEAALIKMGDKDTQLLREETEKVMSDRKLGIISEDEYISKHVKILKRMKLFYQKDRLVAPLIIVSNLMGVLIAASIPVALNSAATNSKNLSLDLSSLNIFFGCGECVIPLPGEGTQTLTFFSSAVIIIILGKVIPKKLGSHYSYWFLKGFYPLINCMSVLFGWLGTAILAIIDIPVLLLARLKK